MTRNQRDGAAGFIIILLLVAGLGAIHPTPPDAWTLEAMGSMNPATEYCETHAGTWVNPLAADFVNCDLNGAFVECHAAPPFGGIDEDADGASEYADSSCIVLIDTDLNGVCDARGVQSRTGFENNSPYQRVSDGLNPACTGWE